MNPLEFEKHVINALENIPEAFKEKLDNVDVVIEDWPTHEQSRGKLLLGLYQGVPLTARTNSYTLIAPDKISIFQGPIELVSHGQVDLIEKIVIDTVIHEIAHHFGISDERLEEIKRQKNSRN